jgi:hypothetical protein
MNLCGIPLVGYGNLAVKGLLNLGDVRWMTPVNAGEEMTDQDANRVWVTSNMRNVPDFSKSRGFEAKFKGRVDHLWQIVKNTAELERLGTL